MTTTTTYEDAGGESNRRKAKEHAKALERKRARVAAGLTKRIEDCTDCDGACYTTEG